MAVAEMLHADDPVQKLLFELGDLSGFELFHNQVLVAVYQRPEKTKSGILLARQTLDEDRFQSKVGLVVKMGPQAFVNSGNWVFDYALEPKDWVVYQPQHGWAITIKGVLCRVLVDTSIKARINHPDMVW